MAKIYVKIKGIHCQNCETTIQKVLLNLPPMLKKLQSKTLLPI